MGGAWERMIRTVRKVLLGVCVDQRLSDESFETLLTEIEAIINGRPLTKLSENHDDPAPLTPNHLLIVSSGASLAPGKFDDADALRRRWKLVQRVADKFWLKQYITGLQSRAKWQREKDNLGSGVISGRVFATVFNFISRFSYPFSSSLFLYLFYHQFQFSLLLCILRYLTMM